VCVHYPHRALSCVNDLGQFLGLLIMQPLLLEFGECFERCAAAEGGMQPLAVVEDLDVAGAGAVGEGLPGLWKLKRPPTGRWAEAGYCIRLSRQPRSWGWFLPASQRLRGRGG
jgi:hypothetical protein